MEIADSVIVLDKVEGPGAAVTTSQPVGLRHRAWIVYALLILIAGTTYLTGILSPPSIQDDSGRSAGADCPHHAGHRRLGYGATRRHSLSGKAAAPLLDDGRLLQSIWRTRLGGANSYRAVLRGSLPADRRVWNMGVWPESRDFMQVCAWQPASDSTSSPGFSFPT